MKIKIIGCGTAFYNPNHNTAFLLEENDERFLIDCGGYIPGALVQQGFDLKKIKTIYISHAHGDHCHGLEEMAFANYDWKNHPVDYRESEVDYAPTLIANEVLLTDLWRNTLSGGLKSMEGFDATISTYFKPKPIKANKTFEWQGWTCSLIQQIHVITGSMIMNAFGLFLEKDEKTVFFTTDAQYFQPEQVAIFYDKAQLIFQDCELTGVNVPKEQMVFKSGVHANYAQLAGWPTVNAYRLSEAVKKKLWLCHYQGFKNEGKDFFNNIVDWDSQARDDGFAGFVAVGQEFTI